MEVFDLIKGILLVAIPLLVFLILIFGKKDNSEEHQDYLMTLMENKSRDSRLLNRYIEKMELFISRYGADYNIGISKVKQLLILKVCFFAIFIFLGSQVVSMPIILLVGIVGWKFPDIMIKMLNKKDNEKIFRDMKMLYDSLRIQQSAGIFITNSLMYSYRIVRCKRLKAALRSLSSDIMLNKKDIGRALNALSIKFKNDNIDEFVSIISQSIQTGRMVDMLEQINKQMENMEEILNQKRENAVNARMLIIIMLLFVGIIAMVTYGAFSSSVFTEIQF